MMKFLSNPNTRFCIAIGASAGLGHALFRSLTTNLGPITGLAAGTLTVAAITCVIYLVLGWTTKRA